MTELLLILIFVMLWVCSCTVCVIAGFYIAKRLPARSKPPPAPASLSDEERHKVKKAQHEYHNFLNYAGDEMTPYEQQIR